MSNKYTLKFYKGRKLIAEHTWDLNESFLDEITHDAESIIDEAIECNPPDTLEWCANSSKWEEAGLK